MKVLSIKQPWAELILQGRKTIEIRKWNTRFRGEFLIHSSKIPDEEAMRKFGLDNLLNGYVLGKAILRDVKHYKNPEEFLEDSDKHLATSYFEAYGFVLIGVKRVAPIKAKGRLGFWEFIKFK